MAAVVSGMLVVASVPAMAADKYSSGTKTWDTTSNWGTSGGSYSGAQWVDDDNAFFEGSAGTVTLGEAISISNLTVDLHGYTIEDNTLNFAAGGALASDHPANGSVTITCGITGSPSVSVNGGNGVGNPWFSSLYLSPTSGDMALGTISRPRDNNLYLGGTTTGNSLVAIPKGNGNAKVYKVDSGTWTLGDAYGNNFYISDGNLIANGEITTKGGFSVNGGVLHYNNAGAFGSDGKKLTFNGGELDNSSSAAITASYATPLSWNANWTFIGSQGADSDLDLGTGAVTMNADRTVTVSNSATTLTIGGAIGDSGNGYSLTKAGAGTLKLTGTSTYAGDTIISAGTNIITQPYLSGNASVWLTDGAVLNLAFAGTNDVLDVYTNGVVGPKGTWGSLASTADNKTALITGPGLLNVLIPVALDGIRYWDGGDSNLAGTGNALSDGDGGTWSTSIKNWDCGAGVAYTNWNNSTDELAIFEGGGGTVTLGDAISISNLTINVAGYTIQGNSLSFATDGSINITHPAANTTISTGITGSPDINCNILSGPPWGYGLILAPSAASMTIGKLTQAHDCNVTLGGTATDNSVDEVQLTKDKLYKTGSGVWRVGNINKGIYIQEGTLIADGTIDGTARIYSGATLKGTGVINGPVTFPSAGTIAPGYPTGTLTITNNGCTINGNLDITIDGALNGTLAVDGNLDVTSATLNVTVSSMPSGAAIIATYTTLDQPFDTITGLDGVGNNAYVDYVYNSGTAIAIINPPPAGSLFILR